jgi:hypothetical protein
VDQWADGPLPYSIIQRWHLSECHAELPENGVNRKHGETLRCSQGADGNRSARMKYWTMAGTMPPLPPFWSSAKESVALACTQEGLGPPFKDEANPWPGCNCHCA